MNIRTILPIAQIVQVTKGLPPRIVRITILTNKEEHFANVATSNFESMPGTPYREKLRTREHQVGFQPNLGGNYFEKTTTGRGEVIKLPPKDCKRFD